jgi:ABC-type multidrug transport system permease subunit
MKRWALLTVLLYGIVLLLLTVPMMMVFGLDWQEGGATGWRFGIDSTEAFEVFGEWGYWLWFIVMLGAQAILLLVPVAVAERRPRPRRKLLLSIVTTAFLLANLFLVGVFSIASAAFGDEALEIFDTLGKLTAKGIAVLPALSALAGALGVSGSDGLFATLNLIGLVVLLWMIWGLIFYRFACGNEPDGWMHHTTRWLIRGSILELLVAVPSHLVVRARDDCCAPVVTFWGMACGISVMLLAFGPGVFFLFAKRMRRVKPAQAVPENSPPR